MFLNVMFKLQRFSNVLYHFVLSSKQFSFYLYCKDCKVSCTSLIIDAVLSINPWKCSNNYIINVLLVQAFKNSQGRYHKKCLNIFILLLSLLCQCLYSKSLGIFFISVFHFFRKLFILIKHFISTNIFSLYFLSVEVKNS